MTYAQLCFGLIFQAIFNAGPAVALFVLLNSGAPELTMHRWAWVGVLIVCALSFVDHTSVFYRSALQEDLRPRVGN